MRYPGNTFGYGDKAVSDFKGRCGVDPFDLSTALSTPSPEQFITKRMPITARWEYYYYSLWIEHKSKYITSLVSDLKGKLEKAGKEGASPALSAAVFPDRNTAYFSKSQDWGGWLDNGSLDMVMPMAYYGSRQRVMYQIYNAKYTAKSAKVIAGLGAWIKDDREIKREIRSLQKFNLDGFSFFSYGGVTEDAGYLKSIRRKIFTPRAKVVKKARALKTPPGFEFASHNYDISGGLDNVISNEFAALLEKAKSRGYVAGATEVDEFLGCLKKQFYSIAEYELFLNRTGADEAALRITLADDITVMKYITSELYPKVALRADQLVDIPKSVDYQMIYRYAHPKDSVEKWEKERAKIDKAYGKLKSGADFSDVAKEFSTSATASNGGHYKNRYFDELDDLSDILFALREGEVSGVVKRPSGYAIFKLNSLRPEARMVYKNVNSAVKRVIFYNALKEEIMHSTRVAL